MSGKNVDAKSFVPHNMSNINRVRPAQIKIKNDTVEYKGEKIDPKRTFTKEQGEYIWENSNTHSEFDSEIFKKDLFGGLVSIGIRYSGNKNEFQKRFAYDLEHIVSHSNFGKTTCGNCALLNSGINRSKGQKECYTINMNEYVGLKTRYSVLPEDLLIELETNLHETCRKYNLVFLKNLDNTWTLKKSIFDEYYQYNDEYDNDDLETLFEEESESISKKSMKDEPKKDQKEKTSVLNAFFLATGAKIITENVVLAGCSVYNFTFTKTRNLLYKENEIANFETTETQKNVANVAGWVSGLYVGVTTLI